MVPSFFRASSREVRKGAGDSTTCGKTRELENTMMRAVVLTHRRGKSRVLLRTIPREFSRPLMRAAPKRGYEDSAFGIAIALQPFASERVQLRLKTVG